jgi:hypothetical protein
MPTDITAIAMRKYGPLPVWAWGVGFVAMVGGFWYLRKRGSFGGGGEGGGDSIAYVQPDDLLGPFASTGGGGGGGASAPATPNGVGTPAGQAATDAPPSWLEDVLAAIGAAIDALPTPTTQHPNTGPNASPSTPTAPGATIPYDAGPGNTGGGQVNTAPTATPEIEPGVWAGLGTPANTGYVNRTGDWIPPAIITGPKPSNVPAGALPTEAGTWAIPPTTVNQPPVQSPSIVTLAPGASGAYVTNRSSGSVQVRPMTVPQSSLAPGSFVNGTWTPYPTEG